MYRFRSVNNLIGPYQELEKQQIYFAAPDELNDPLEGPRRYFWQGDRIVWENFPKHYILCLDHVILLARLSPVTEGINKKYIPIYISGSKLPTQQYRDKIRKINETFFSNPIVDRYLPFLISNANKIYRDELYVHLKILSHHAIGSIIQVDRLFGLIPKGDSAPALHTVPAFGEHAARAWDEVKEHPEWNSLCEQAISRLHDALKNADNDLLLKFQQSPKMQSIYVEFPQLYLDAVVQLTYPTAYIACFMDDCMNSSIWGTYGNNHAGVCLKFSTGDSSHPSLPLNAKVGFNGTRYFHEFRPFPLRRMTYTTKFEELDFFRNLGRLPLPQLREQWYTDGAGNVSVCGDDILQRESDWRERHWQSYDRAYLTKLPDWAHEREYRILLVSALEMYEDPKERVLEYKFANLEAIIFGLKTSNEDRAKIVVIIKRKCEETGRTQFDFFEMAHSDRKNALYSRQLNPLRK